MRELGFRAWLKNYNCYAEVLGFDEGMLIVHLQRGELVEHRLHVPIEDCILEQYTGLKDKNGKKIYEGDIVASSYFGEGRILKVVFYEGCFCLCETWLKIPHAGCVYYFRQGSRFRPQDDYEVIGNIHENPELLEGKK